MVHVGALTIFRVDRNAKIIVCRNEEISSVGSAQGTPAVVPNRPDGLHLLRRQGGSSKRPGERSKRTGTGRCRPHFVNPTLRARKGPGFRGVLSVPEIGSR